MCKNYFIFVNGSPNAFVWDLIFPLDNISPYKYNIFIYFVLGMCQVLGLQHLRDLQSLLS